MVRGLGEHDIPATQIGRMIQGPRALVHPNGRLEKLDHLDRDELYRILESSSQNV